MAQRKHPPPRHAVIDIGSNAVRLQIGTLADGRIITEVFTRIPLGLGSVAYRGSGNANRGNRRRIPAVSIRRLIDTLSGMKHLIASMKPCRHSIVATAAVRDAENRSALLADVRAACGACIRILSGEQEAGIIGRYAASHFTAAAVLNIDIGGGSTDCAVIRSGALTNCATFALGTARADGGETEEKNRCHTWLRQHTPANAIVSSSGGSALQLQQSCGALTTRHITRWEKEIDGLSIADLCTRYDMSPDRAAHNKHAIQIYHLLLTASKTKEMHPVRGGLSEALIWQTLTAQG